MIDNIEIVHVVAHDINGAIGKGNKLPWRIPSDLKHFHNITHNNIIVMGRKTFESIGKALPHRDNIVISRNIEFEPDNAIRMGRIDTAIAYAISLAKYKNQKQIFIIGGAELYKQTLSITDRIESSLIMTEIKDPDAFYNAEFNGFKLNSEKETFDSNAQLKVNFRTFLRV